MALKGITVLELAGLAPSQYCGMVLADFGANVIRIDKVRGFMPQDEFLGNGKLSIALDLKKPEGANVFKKVCSKADVLIDPFRGGVLEKLGLGPKELMKSNGRLVYTRLSGFGQTGPLSKYAGHDINFLSLSGVLSFLGWRGKAPTPPCNILADFGGGGLMGAFGIVAALLERTSSGKGQVLDLSITGGSAYLASWIFQVKDYLWSNPRGNNYLDGGLAFYDTYETKDEKWMGVGALEAQFRSSLLGGLGLTEDDLCDDEETNRLVIGNKFKERTQQEWIKTFGSLDACCTPVLSSDEAARCYPDAFVRTSTGGHAPRPQPLMSRTPAIPVAQRPPPVRGQHTADLLAHLAGITPQELARLVQMGAVSISNAKL